MSHLRHDMTALPSNAAAECLSFPVNEQEKLCNKGFISLNGSLVRMRLFTWRTETFGQRNVKSIHHLLWSLIWVFISALVIWGLVCCRFSAESTKATKRMCWTSTSAPCNLLHCNSLGNRSVQCAKARAAPGQTLLLLAASFIFFVKHQVNVLIMHVSQA